MLSSKEFDQGCDQINAAIDWMRQWKHNYFGAAYTTRLGQLSKDLRVTAANVDDLIRRDCES